MILWLGFDSDRDNLSSDPDRPGGEITTYAETVRCQRHNESTKHHNYYASISMRVYILYSLSHCLSLSVYMSVFVYLSFSLSVSVSLCLSLPLSTYLCPCSMKMKHSMVYGAVVKS